MQKSCTGAVCREKIGPSHDDELGGNVVRLGKGVELRCVHLLQCYKHGKYGRLLRSNLLQKALQRGYKGATNPLKGEGIGKHRKSEGAWTAN